MVEFIESIGYDSLNVARLVFCLLLEGSDVVACSEFVEFGKVKTFLFVCTRPWYIIIA